MDDFLQGWLEIANYFQRDVRTVQRWAQKRGLPVHREPGGGKKSRVFAIPEELDSWRGVQRAVPVEEHSDHGVGQQLFEKFRDRVSKIMEETKLFRRDYVLRFDITRTIGRRIEAEVECEFELFNATDQPQPYTQILTIDDSDEGFVKEMTLYVSPGPDPGYSLKRPAITEKHLGYAEYRGRPVTIRARSAGVRYRFRASWVVHCQKNDLWYNHLVMPTFGIRVETHAPPEFVITPSFYRPDLVMVAEHIDVAWKERSPVVRRGGIANHRNMSPSNGPHLGRSRHGWVNGLASRNDCLGPASRGAVGRAQLPGTAA